MKTRRVFAFLLAAVVGLGAGTGCMHLLTRSPQQSPERLVQIRTVAVVPPRAEVWEVAAGANQHTRAQESGERIEANLTAVITKEFSRLPPGLSLRTIAREALDSPPTFPWTVGRYHIPRGHTNGSCPRNVRTPDADAIFWVDAIQTVKTPGARVKGALIVIHPGFWLLTIIDPISTFEWAFGSGQTNVRFCLVDQRIPRVTAWAYTKVFEGGLDLRDPDSADGLVHEAFEDLGRGFATSR